MGTVTLQAGHNPNAYNHLAGNHNDLYYFDENTFEIPKVAQAAMDAALITYAADQANIDNDFADIVADEITDRDKDAYDDKSEITALIKEMVDQLNELRALHSLPALNFGQVNAGIRNRIGQP